MSFGSPWFAWLPSGDIEYLLNSRGILLSGDARLAHSEKLARVPEKVHTRLGNVPMDTHTTFGGHMTLHVESSGLILPQSKIDYEGHGLPKTVTNLR